MARLEDSPSNDLRREWRRKWNLEPMTAAELAAGTENEARTVSPQFLAQNLPTMPVTPAAGSFVYGLGGDYAELTDPGDGAWEITFTSGVPSFTAAGGVGIQAGTAGMLTTGTDTVESTWQAKILQDEFAANAEVTPNTKLPQSPAAGATLYGAGGNYSALAPPTDGAYSVTWTANVPSWTLASSGTAGTAGELTTGTETAQRTWSPKILQDEFAANAEVTPNTKIPQAPTNGDLLYGSGGDYAALADPGDGQYGISYATGVPSFVAVATDAELTAHAALDTHVPTPTANGDTLYAAGGSWAKLTEPGDGTYNVTWTTGVPSYTATTVLSDLTNAEIVTGTDTAAQTISAKVFAENMAWENVVTHGADPTGVSDSKAAFQAAIDALPATGGTVIAPPGTYSFLAGPGAKIFNALGHPDNVHLIGYGATIVYPASVDEASNTYGFYCRLIDKLSIRGFTFDGNRGTRTTLPSLAANHAIFLDGCSNVVIEDCRVIDWTSDGIYVGEIAEAVPCTDVEIRNCSATGSRRNGLSIVVGNRVRVSGGSYFANILDVPSAGIDVEPTTTNAVSEVVIDGVNFYGNKRYGLLATGQSGTVDNVQVSNCSFVGGTDASYTADVRILDATGVKVTDSIFSTGSIVVNGTISIENGDWAQISDNRFVDHTHAGSIVDIDAASTKVAVYGNSVENQTVSAVPAIDCASTTASTIGPNEIGSAHSVKVTVASVNYDPGDVIIGGQVRTLPDAPADGNYIIDWATSVPTYEALKTPQTGTAGAMMYGDGTNYIELAPPTDGAYEISWTANVPSWTAASGGSVPAASGNGGILHESGSAWVTLEPPIDGNYIADFTAGQISWEAILTPQAAGAAGKMLRSNGTAYVDSTPTWPDSAVDGSILVGDGTNWLQSPQPAASQLQALNYDAGRALSFVQVESKANYDLHVADDTHVPTPVANGDTLYAAGGSWSILTDPVSNGDYVQTWTTGVPSWTTLKTPQTGTAGAIMYGDGTNYVELAPPTDGTYEVTWTANVPSWTVAGGGGVPAASGNGGILREVAGAWATLEPPADGNYIADFTTGQITWEALKTPQTATDGAVLVGDGTNYIELAPPSIGNYTLDFAAGNVLSYETLRVPTTAGAAGKILRSDGTNYIDSTPTFPNTAVDGSLFVGDGTNWLQSAQPAASQVQALSYDAGRVLSFVEVETKANYDTHVADDTHVPVPVANGDTLYAAGGSWSILTDPVSNGDYVQTWTTGVPSWTTLKTPQTGTAGAMMYGDGTNYIELAPPTDGAYEITWTANVPSWTAAGGGSVPAASGNGGILREVAGAWAILEPPADGNYIADFTTGQITWEALKVPQTATDGAILIGDGTNYIEVSPPATGNYTLDFGVGNVLTYETLRVPTTAGAVGKVLRSDGTNYVDSTPTWPDSAVDGSLLVGDGTNWLQSPQPAASQLQALSYDAGRALSFVQVESKANYDLHVADDTHVPVPVANGDTLYAAGGSWSILTDPVSNGDYVTTWTTGVPSWTTVKSAADLPASVGAAGKILRSNGTDYAETTATYPDAAGTTGKVLQSNGTNFVESTATYPASAGTAGKFLRSDGTNFIESTPTYPTTATDGSLLIGDGTNVIEVAAPAASEDYIASFDAGKVMTWKVAGDHTFDFLSVTSGTTVTLPTIVVGMPHIIYSCTGNGWTNTQVFNTADSATITNTAASLEKTAHGLVIAKHNNTVNGSWTLY